MSPARFTPDFIDAVVRQISIRLYIYLHRSVSLNLLSAGQVDIQPES